jgi:2-haloacid dehalogenase
MSSSFIGIRACVFDAYGTLFDVHSAVGRHRERLGDKADAVSMAWRTKQLEYTWLRSLMGRYVDFWQVTGHALAYALDAHGVRDPRLEDDLLQAYLSLECYPEVPRVLGELRQAGMKTAVLSNGSPMMLEAAVGSSGIGALLDAVISVDVLGVFKPDLRVYQLAIETLGVGRDQVSFQSSNAWDAAAAATFGFKVAWCNRFSQVPERLPDAPHAEVRSLAELPPLLGLRTSP